MYYDPLYHFLLEGVKFACGRDSGDLGCGQGLYDCGPSEHRYCGKVDVDELFPFLVAR